MIRVFSSISRLLPQFMLLPELMKPVINPFETRWLKPTAVTFIPAGFPSLSALTEQLKTTRWRGEITGPHGVGKSSLLQALYSELEKQEIPATLLFARGPFPHREPVQTMTRLSPHIKTGGVLMLDGFEQLPWWTRWQLKQKTDKLDCGLIVTTHKSQKLPRLIMLQARQQTVIQLIAKLQQAHDATPLISDQDAVTLYQQYGDNVRELLFACYDLYEKRCARLKPTAHENN